MSTNVLDRQWWMLVIDHWNSSNQRSKLAGLGTVAFRVTDRDIPDISVEWDEQGLAGFAPTGTAAPVSISATFSNWMAFMSGRMGAPAAVLAGKLTLEGHSAAILPYAVHFAALAQVASAIPPQDFA